MDRKLKQIVMAIAKFLTILITAINIINLSFTASAQEQADIDTNFLNVDSPEYQNMAGLSDNMIRRLGNPNAKIDIRGFNPRQLNQAKIIREAQQAIDIENLNEGSFEVDLMFKADFDARGPRPSITGNFKQGSNFRVYDFDFPEDISLDARGLLEFKNALRFNKDEPVIIITNFEFHTRPKKRSPGSIEHATIFDSAIPHFAEDSDAEIILINLPAGRLNPKRVTEDNPSGFEAGYLVSLSRDLENNNGLLDGKHEVLKGTTTPYARMEKPDGSTYWGGAWAILSNAVDANDIPYSRERLQSIYAGSLGLLVEEVNSDEHQTISGARD